MKKGLTILIATLVVFAMILAGGGASADDLLIGRSVEISGTGVINADIEVQTTGGYVSGIALRESISTPGAGFSEPSRMKYFSSFEVGMYNENDSTNSSAEMEYESVADILNAKRTMYTKNYALGAVMGFKAQGDTGHEIAMYSDLYGMETEISGESVGKLKLFEKVVDIKDHHTVLTSDIIELQGEYKVDWSAFVERIEYPASKTDSWLGCP